MRKIECIVREDSLVPLRENLKRLGIGGLTISHVKGFGKETTRPENYLVLPKAKVELYCTEEQMGEIVATIMATCRTGSFGDGKIAIFTVDDMIRIRTGETQEAAIL